MKQLVILDLDDTIYDEREYFSGVFSLYENTTGLCVGSLLRAFDSVDRKDSRDILKDTLIAASIYSPEHHDELFSYYRSGKFNLDIPPSSVDFLQQLKRNHIQVAVLTNGVVDVQKNKATNLGLSSYVDEVFYARDNNEMYEKPDIRCFQHVLDFFNCRAENAIMIGDSYNNDYLGAKNASVEALWLHGDKPEAIDSLKQALPFIFGSQQ